MTTNNMLNSPEPFSISVGGTGSSSVISTPPVGSAAWSGWDANSNHTSNSVIQYQQNVTLAGGSTSLTVSSAPFVIVGGTSGTVVLPNATTLANNQSYYFNQNSMSGTLTIQTFGGAPLLTAPPGSFVVCYCLSNSTSAGIWDYHWFIPSNVAWGTAGLPYINTGKVPVFSASGTTQSVPSGPNTLIAFGTVAFDNLSNYINTSGNYRFTAPYPGIYGFNANVTVPSILADTYTIYIYKNGSPFSSTVYNFSASTTSLPLVIAQTMQLLANDVIQIFASQNTGFSVTFTLGSFTGRFISN